MIRDSWNEQREVREIAMLLQEHGASLSLAQPIFETYGDEAREIIADDPYRLAHDVDGIGFLTADALAQKFGLPMDSVSRYVAGLQHALSVATDDGHVFLERTDLLRRAARVLNARVEALEPAVLELVRSEEVALDGDNVYLGAFHTAECGAARFLGLIRDTPSPLILDRGLHVQAAVRLAAAQQGLVLADGQIRAAETALKEKISILTGGPGTGKTLTLRTVITALEASDVSFRLCAPTGRAAKRVAETTGRPASTIHRLLEYQPSLNAFGYDRDRRLPVDFVIVDEVSMLDIVLFYHLLKAIPEEAHLLLVGDADQLPAVGPGRVLGDLIESAAIPTTTLTELFRQAANSHIVLAAHAVNHGEIPVATNQPENDFFFVETETPEATLTAIKRLVSERIPKRFGFDPIDDIQVVAPMHAGAVGVVSLNRELQLLLNPARPGLPEMNHAGRLFRVGDKVMQIRNDYDRDIYNGDVGRVTQVSPEDSSLVVAFPAFGVTEDVEYGSMDLEQLTLAYAASVHKSQGSEFPCIVMPVVTAHYVLLRRNLLYTAITRAKQLCVLVGSRKGLAMAVAEGRAEKRNSGLAGRLAPAPRTLEAQFAGYGTQVEPAIRLSPE
jgi:exodeoxyribonuclease V alpha subunit